MQIESPRPAQAVAMLRFRLFAARIGGRGSARFGAAGPIARGFRPTRLNQEQPIAMHWEDRTLQAHTLLAQGWGGRTPRA